MAIVKYLEGFFKRYVKVGLKSSLKIYIGKSLKPGGFGKAIKMQSKEGVNLNYDNLKVRKNFVEDFPPASHTFVIRVTIGEEGNYAKQGVPGCQNYAKR